MFMPSWRLYVYFLTFNVKWCMFILPYEILLNVLLSLLMLKHILAGYNHSIIIIIIADTSWQDAITHCRYQSWHYYGCRWNNNNTWKAKKHSSLIHEKCIQTHQFRNSYCSSEGSDKYIFFHYLHIFAFMVCKSLPRDQWLAILMAMQGQSLDYLRIAVLKVKRRFYEYLRMRWGQPWALGHPLQVGITPSRIQASLAERVRKELVSEEHFSLHPPPFWSLLLAAPSLFSISCLFTRPCSQVCTFNLLVKP